MSATGTTAQQRAPAPAPAATGELARTGGGGDLGHGAAGPGAILPGGALTYVPQRRVTGD
ncbi:hypothetical protein ABH931_000903 [Streptacidiphilus sp. MAP12-33]|uniref:hypothetical protein n=1 Tax=Streptacidiphilus sp. MAP12-33 TaxID=3156266 RepID=UPI0035173C64